MDPVVAVGLATNVAQLVEISWKIVSKSHEIYKHGALPEHRDTETVTADLQNINDKLLGFLNEAEKEKDLSDEDEALRQLCESSNKIATELIKRLNTLKVGDEYRNWKSIRHALKAVWIKSELDETAARLQAYRSQLNTRILVSVRQKLDRLDHNTQTITSNISDTRVLFISNQEIQTHYLTNLITSQHEKTRELLASLEHANLGRTFTATPSAIPSGQTIKQRPTEQIQGPAIFQAVSQRSMARLRRILREDPSAIFAYNATGQTALHLAASMGDEEMVMYLIRMSARINPDDDDGKLPLHYGVLSGSEAVVRALIEKGADPQAKDTEGRTPQDLCASSSLMNWILTHGARLEVKNDDDLTALSYFAQQGDQMAVQWLLDRGANIETVGPDNTTPLLYAAEAGHVEVLQLLLNRNANVHHSDDRKATALIRAGWHGKIRIGELLLDHGADIEARNQHAYTALDECCSHSRVEMGLMLLKRGARFDRCNNIGYAPIHQAAMNGRLALVKAIIDRGGDVNILSHAKWTALAEASERGHLDVVKLLIAHGAAVEIPTDDDRKTALLRAAEGGHAPIVEFMISHTQADIETRDSGMYTPLCRAAQNTHRDVVEVLLKAGANVNAFSSSSWTPLQEVAVRGDIAITKILLDYGANANLTNDSLWSPLHEAATRGFTTITKMLLEHGADPNARDNVRWGEYTPLNRAAQKSHSSTVRALLEDSRTQIDITNREGWSSLAEACHHGSLEIAQMLLERGANADTRDRLQYTPLNRAAQAGHHALVCLLLDHGQTDINVTNTAGWSLLMEASWHGFPNIARLLLERGAKKDLCNDNGDTALTLAKRKNHREIVALLT